MYQVEIMYFEMRKYRSANTISGLKKELLLLGKFMQQPY